MTRIHRGRGGSVTRTAEVAHIVAAALICFSLGVAGCSSKKPESIGALNGGSQTGSDFSSKSTLEKVASGEGTIGGEGGPLSDIHFGYNDYTVQPQDSSILRTNASWL